MKITSWIQDTRSEFLYSRHLRRIAPPDLQCRGEEGCPWRKQFKPLLQALHWKGTQRQFEDALPPHDKELSLQEFRSAMALLGYISYLREAKIGTVNERWLPLIVVDEKSVPHLLTKPEELQRFSDPHQAVFLLLFEATTPTITEGTVSLRQLLKRFYPVLRQVTLISVLIGILALVPTFFNMAVYDHIIGSGSAQGLFMLLLGALLALAAEVGFRQLRGRRLGYFGARIDHFVSISVFERLLALSPSYTERASVSAQLARLRDFESVREFFTGPLSSLLFEMPIVLIYFLALLIIGHWLALVPLALAVAYAIIIGAMLPRLRDNARMAANAATRKQEFLLETVSKLHEIRLAGLEEKWQKRHRKLSGEASEASFRAGFSAQWLETASYVLMTLGGVTTLGFGVALLINGDLTTGALVASMLIIWRILAPMQIACASVTRLQQLSASVKQVQRLLSVTPEFDFYKHPMPLDTEPKRITFHRVSLRYGPEAEPALLGVSFDIKPGSIAAIMGGNGCGKSTVLKMLLGLYQPQGGSVRLDGVDIRQIDPLVLRQSIAYAPQHAELFPGTVRDNLRFADPTADDQCCIEALKLACAYEEVMQLSRGLDTYICGPGSDTIPFMLGQRLNLARAYVRPSPIMLFDEASHSLGKENDAAFAQVIAALKGRSTVLMVTHREDHMRLSDQLLVLQKGELTHAGPPDQVLTVLRGKRI